MNAIESSTSARVDLKDTPLDGGEHLYIDGSCLRPSDGVYLCGYAIVTQAGERVEAYSLNHNSAQAAEIIALTRACELTKGKRATIYTDSKYSYGSFKISPRLGLGAIFRYLRANQYHMQGWW